MRALALAGTAIFGLVGCGGGGGGSDRMSMTLQPDPVAITLYKSQLPYTQAVYAQVRGRNILDADPVYIMAYADGDAFVAEPTSVDFFEDGFSAEFVTQDNLDYGTYTGTITALVCEDELCARVLGNDSVPYTLTVAMPATTIPSEPLAMGGIVGGIVEVEVTMTGASVETPYYGRVTGGGDVFSGEVFALVNNSSPVEWLARMPVLPTATATLHEGTLTLDVCGDAACQRVFGSQEMSYAVHLLEVLAGEELTMAYADGMGAAARFSSIRDMAADSAGNLFVGEFSDTPGGRLRRVTPEGVVTTVYTGSDGTPVPEAVAIDASDNIYFGGGNGVYRRTPLGVDTAFDAERVNGLATDAAGNVWSATYFGDVVQRAANGTLLRTIEPAITPLSDIAVDSSGKAYVTSGQGITAIAPDNSEALFVGEKAAVHIARETSGTMVFTAVDQVWMGWENGVFRVALDGALTELLPRVIKLPGGTDLVPYAVAVAPDGRLYLSGYSAIFRTTVAAP